MLKSCLLLAAITHGAMCCLPQDPATLHLSHDATVQIVFNNGVSTGSGFMIGDRLVLTCLHVVSVPNTTGPLTPQQAVPNNIYVVTSSGERIDAELASIPDPKDPTPFLYDFAFLRLAHKPIKPFDTLLLASTGDLRMIELGDAVAFSGFPLNTPGMVTLRGMISGTSPDRSLLFIEGPINKGNSGGALVNASGAVIGIVSLREGGISPELEALDTKLINQSQSGNKVVILGLDPVTSTGALIETVDKYISVGIGYARSIQFAKDYLNRHPELEK